MTNAELIERITRSLAYMLRHQPEEFDLELDSHGFGDMREVARALSERLGEEIRPEDVESAISSGDRPRYEIVGDKVRALYGHSIDIDPGEPGQPPDLLYVGINSRDAKRAVQYGLRGGRRRFLHLARTIDDARETGRRSGVEYSVLEVHALDAWEDGVDFYDRQALFLAEHIPTEFLQIAETRDDGYERELRGGPRGGDRPRGGRRERGGRFHEHGPRGGERSGREGRPQRSEAPERSAAPERGERHEHHERHDRPDRAERGDRRGDGGPRRGGRGPRPDRPDRQRREGHAQEGGERAARGPDRGPDRGSDRGSDRGPDNGRPRRDEPRERAAPPRERPERERAPAPPAVPAPAAGPTFGSGVFEAQPAPRRAPPPPPPPPPRPAAPAPVREPADGSPGFGAGI
jgi:putative RNA 2'-phosphotransferase